MSNEYWRFGFSAPNVSARTGQLLRTPHSPFVLQRQPANYESNDAVKKPEQRIPNCHKTMNRRLLLCLAFLVTMMRAIAQQPLKPLDPPELIASRADHLRAMQRAAIPPLTNYLRTLEPLQQFYTRQGKADAAAAVTAEITAVKEQLEEAQA